MTVHVILAGKFRGNSHGWESLFNLIDADDIRVYAGSPTPWQDFSIPHKFVSTHLEETIFHQSTHIHQQNYISQWSSLRLTYEAFKHEMKETDIVIKARNDLLIDGPFSGHIEPNTIYVPAQEFHMNVPFDIERVCNDQILLGYKPVMDTYFKLSKLYTWDGQYDDGIEAVLRKYLRQQNIQIKTFELNYKKIG